MAPVRVMFGVPERDLEAFRQTLATSPGPTARAIDPNSGKTLAQGVADFIDSSIDTASGTVAIKAAFANADDALWPGQYVNVEVDVGVHPNATVIPLTAVQLNGSNSFVFLVKPDQTVVRQLVDRHAREYRPSHRRGHETLRGRVDGQPRGWVHHRFDHDLSGRGLPPSPCPTPRADA